MSGTNGSSESGSEENSDESSKQREDSAYVDELVNKFLKKQTPVKKRGFFTLFNKKKEDLNDVPGSNRNENGDVIKPKTGILNGIKNKLLGKKKPKM